MLRTRFMQRWFTVSDPATEEALHDVPLFREFAQLNWDQRRPDESTILQGVTWRVAMKPGKRRALDKTRPVDSLIDQIERLKASMRAKVEHPFRVFKRQFGRAKVRYRGLAKNTAKLKTLFALVNLLLSRKKLLLLDGQVRLKTA